MAKPKICKSCGAKVDQSLDVNYCLRCKAILWENPDELKNRA